MKEEADSTSALGKDFELPQMKTEYTLADEFELSGVGLHSGALAKVRVLPDSTGKGRYFVRTDLPGSPIIPAHWKYVRQTVLSTELANENASVRTVEHLLAALAAMGVDNARIEIDGPEVPLLDGSAKLWAEAIADVGLSETKTTSSPPCLSLTSPIWVHEGDAFVAALPAEKTRFSYAIDFELPAIGQQWYSWVLSPSSFITEIAPARTFGLAHQIDQLLAQGLIKGGSLDNALVCGAEGWLNPPLRFANEPVRHKILDLVGDISLLGKFPSAHIIAYKASHKLHVQLFQSLIGV